MSRRLVLISLSGLAAVALAAFFGLAAYASSPCTPAQLHGKLAVIRGSAGAGQIGYRLVLKNISSSRCVVSGRPALALRNAHGHKLPTHVSAEPPGSIGVLVTLAPGQSAAARLRFSPDVPGPGESTSGPCEQTAHTVQVTLASPGNGSLIAALSPPTAVCEHGSMSETNLSRA